MSYGTQYPPYMRDEAKPLPAQYDSYADDWDPTGVEFPSRSDDTLPDFIRYQILVPEWVILSRCSSEAIHVYLLVRMFNQGGIGTPLHYIEAAMTGDVPRAIGELINLGLLSTTRRGPSQLHYLAHTEPMPGYVGPIHAGELLDPEWAASSRGTDESSTGGHR